MSNDMEPMGYGGKINLIRPPPYSPLGSLLKTGLPSKKERNEASFVIKRDFDTYYSGKVTGQHFSPRV